MSTSDNESYYQYTTRFPPELWRRFKKFVEQENKRIGRSQTMSKVLIQCFETGLAQLEKKA